MEEFIPANAYDHLSCPVCFHISKDKVFQCKGGHILCDECYGKVAHCPQCLVLLNPFDPIRCLLAENLLDELRVDCPQKDFGCQKVLDRKSFDEHVKSCVAKNKPVNVCKLLGYTSCNYKIDPRSMKDALEHFEWRHDVEIAENGLISQKLVTEMLLSPTPKKKITILEDADLAIIFLLSTSGRMDLRWTSFYLFHGEEGAEASKEDKNLISEIKLVNARYYEGKGWIEKELLYQDELMPKNILQINQYPIDNPVENYTKLLQSAPFMDKYLSLRLIFNVRKRL